MLLFKEKPGAEDKKNDREGRGLRHVHAIEKRRGTRKQGQQPNQSITDLVTNDYPVTREHRHAREQDCRDLRAGLQVAKPGKWNQDEVIKQVMIDVLPGVERRQRQPRKRRRKMTRPQVVPNQARPLDVIVAVEISAADRGRRIL